VAFSKAVSDLNLMNPQRVSKDVKNYTFSINISNFLGIIYIVIPSSPIRIL